MWDFGEYSIENQLVSCRRPLSEVPIMWYRANIVYTIPLLMFVENSSVSLNFVLIKYDKVDLHIR